jgi:hypothetical protein
MKRTLVTLAVAAPMTLMLGLGTAAAGPLDPGGLATAPTAQASPLAIVCAGTQTTDYEPALTNTTQNTKTTSTEKYHNCTSLAGVSSATGTHTATSPQSCLLALVPPTNTSTRTYTWNNGQSSTITFLTSTVATLLNGTFVITSAGTVTAGLGKGSAATRMVTQPNPRLTACATSGVDSLTGPATLQILL